MGKRLPTTPRSRVRQALRRLWLRSRERALRIKIDGYTCQKCLKKQSRAKGKEFFIECHHLDGIKWDELIDLIYERLLVSPEKLITLCPECHDREEQRGA